MEVRLIENKELLESAELFKIENLLWGTEKIAKTYGYIGFVPGEGLYIKLVCVEKNPLRIYKKDQDPVYKDSAMEAFFQFKGNDTADENSAVRFLRICTLHNVRIPLFHKFYRNCSGNRILPVNSISRIPVPVFLSEA